MSVFGAPLKVLQKNVDLTPELHIFSGVGVGEAGCVWQGVLWSWWSGTVFFWNGVLPNTDEDINTNDTSTPTRVPVSDPITRARARQFNH